MSGLMTPIDSMPQWAQYITYVIPPRYFIEIMRSVYLKGSMFSELWQDFSMLAVFAVFVCLAAMITYKKQLAMETPSPDITKLKSNVTT